MFQEEKQEPEAGCEGGSEAEVESVTMGRTGDEA